MGDSFTDFLSGVPFIGPAIQAGERRRQIDEVNERNYEIQKEFAKHGVRWRVEDALAAGLHPLAALGGSSASASPSFMVGDSSIPDFGAQGQSLGSAINFIKGQDSGQDSFQRQMSKLQLESAKVQLALQKAELGKTLAEVQPQPLKPTFTGDNTGITVGEVPEVTWARTASGGRVPVPSKDVKESIEDQIIQEVGWSLRNNILPPGSIAGSTSDEMWIPGFGWIPFRNDRWMGLAENFGRRFR